MTPFTDDDLKRLKERRSRADEENPGWVTLRSDRLEALLARLEAAEKFKDDAEMSWVVMANVSEGGWKKQTQEWQDAAARWRDVYHQTLDAWRKAAGK